MPNLNQEKRIISEWIAIKKSLGFDIQDIEWLDGPKNGDIEAIALPFAIEHTSVDYIDKQRLYEAHFKKVFNDICLSTVFPSARLKITLNLEDFARTKKAELKTAIKKWIIDVAPDLPEGYSRGSQVENLSIEWRCWKNSNKSPGLSFGISVDTEQINYSFIDLLSRKDQKLETYRRRGLTSVIIVESDDVQLMAPSIFLEMAIKTNMIKNLSTDELWFVDTSNINFEFWHVNLKSMRISRPKLI